MSLTGVFLARMELRKLIHNAPNSRQVQQLLEIKVP